MLKKQPTTKTLHLISIVEKEIAEMKKIYELVQKYKAGFAIGIGVSLVIVIIMMSLNHTAVYAMEIKEVELEKYYESRDLLIEQKSYLIFYEYIENHKDDTEVILKTYPDIVNEAEEIMDEYYLE